MAKKYCRPHENNKHTHTHTHSLDLSATKEQTAVVWLGSWLLKRRDNCIRFNLRSIFRPKYYKRPELGTTSIGKVRRLY